MRIVVLGGGVVGVTTAYQLQKDGHEVVVFERNSEVASEASWGNAGMIAPGHSFVWSSPKAPMILLKSLFLEHQALRFKFSADLRLYSWSWLFLMECTPEKARRRAAGRARVCVAPFARGRGAVAGGQARSSTLVRGAARCGAAGGRSRRPGPWDSGPRRDAAPGAPCGPPGISVSRLSSR
jgi:glycine/D-amino acid oxidase-like deaminating enzyme